MPNRCQTLKCYSLCCSQFHFNFNRCSVELLIDPFNYDEYWFNVGYNDLRFSLFAMVRIGYRCAIPGQKKKKLNDTKFIACSLTCILDNLLEPLHKYCLQAASLE